jgi:hypothetical protein
MKLEFSRSTIKNTQISNIMKIHLVGAEVFHAADRTDERTDKHNEANGRFSQFSERA